MVGIGKSIGLKRGFDQEKAISFDTWLGRGAAISTELYHFLPDADIYPAIR